MMDERNNEARQDNTTIKKPMLFEPIKVKPREYQLVDLGGKPSTDVRTSAQRNRDYFHPIRGAKDRFKASMENKTNPLVGIENTILPAVAGAALVTTPATVIAGTVGGETVNKATGGWGNWLEDKTGFPSELGEFLNPGMLYGGAKGYKIDKNKLASKFIKGDADLGWSALNKSHWIFNREARTPTNVGMALLNRTLPFLSNIGKTPARIAAYKIGKRTKGNASVSLKDIKSNESSYTGAATPDGSSGRNLLGLYIFKDDPLINRSPWFRKIADSFAPASGDGFSYNNRYEKLYPGIENRRYRMESVVKDGYPLKFKDMNEFHEYSNGIGKLQGKEGDMVINIGGQYQTFRQPGTNYVGPIDDVGGHVIKIDYNNKGKLVQTSQDMWKFNPSDYNKRWSGDTMAESIRATKQAALMDKVGTPFILQQENPITIGTSRVWQSLEKIPAVLKQRRVPKVQSGLLTLQTGGRFTFRKNKLTKNASKLNGKRDMRKKFIKSDRPTYSNNRIKKGASGLQFAYYDTIDTPEVSLSNYTIPESVFSPYNIPVSKPEKQSVNKEERVPVMINTPSQPVYKPKSYKGLDTFNKAYDEIEKSNPEARKYRQFLTKMAEQESGFDSAIQNRAGAPAYGYFQFMQDDKKYNNIRQYAGTDIETFRSNPKLQIEAAIKLAKSFEKGFSKEDLELAKQKGYSTWGLLGGAWLAGNGGVRRFLRGQGNPSDRHWSKEGKGTDVASRIKMFN